MVLKEERKLNQFEGFCLMKNDIAMTKFVVYKSSFR